MIMPLNEAIRRGDQPEVRLCSDITLETQDSHVSILVEERKVSETQTLVSSEVSGSIIACQQQTERITSYFTAQLDRIIWINDGSRMHGLKRCLEDVDTFQE